MELLKKFKLPPFPKQLLILLLSADTLYIILHILNRIAVLKGIWPVFARDTFNISFDLGLGESFQYAKELWCALLFGWLVVAKKKKAYIGWSLLFFYFLLDDMLSFHENMSEVVSNWLGLSAPQLLVANLRVKDLGELGYSASVGLLFLLLLGIAYLRSNPNRKRIFHTIAIYLAVFLFFGVGLDTRNSSRAPSHWRRMAVKCCRSVSLWSICTRFHRSWARHNSLQNSQQKTATLQWRF